MITGDKLLSKCIRKQDTVGGTNGNAVPMPIEKPKPLNTTTEQRSGGNSANNK